jgi:hypothetical protein
MPRRPAGAGPASWSKEMATPPVTPGAVAKQYQSLNSEDRVEFFQLLKLKLEDLLAIASQLPDDEEGRFYGWMVDAVGESVLSEVLLKSAEAVRANPDFDTASLIAEVRDDLHRQAAVIREIALAHVKKQRDRKPDPETIRRNVQICDRYHKDQLSKKKLAGHYGVTDRYIRDVIKDELSWRRRLAELSRSTESEVTT